MKYLVLFAFLIITNPAYACFDGYYAPDFMEITNPIIGASALVGIISFIYTIKRKSYIRAVLLFAIYLFISYFGHHLYSGDCGAEIVFLNKVALAFVILWLSTEIILAYLNEKNKKA